MTNTNKYMILTYIGTDDWDRAVFETTEGHILKDLNCSFGRKDLYTASSFDGEPNTSVDNTEKYSEIKFCYIGLQETTDENRHKYILLSRMVADCEYSLKFGNGSTNHLWADGVPEQIAEMKKLYRSFNDADKPEWLTLEQILEYEIKMN